MRGAFDPNARYLNAATAEERAQLDAMAQTIEAKAEELRVLRDRRETLAGRIFGRQQMRERRKGTTGG